MYYLISKNALKIWQKDTMHEQSTNALDISKPFSSKFKQN